MAAIDRLLAVVQERGASDLHLSEGQAPRVRRGGKLETIDGEPPLDGNGIEALLHDITPPEAREKCERAGESIFAHSIDPQRRVRVSIYKHTHGRGAVCRIVPSVIPSLEELGLPPILAEQAAQRSGLVLITGATGAGVTTTAAALLNQINNTQRRRILVLEHPAEFLHQSRQSMISQREESVHTPEISTVLRGAVHAGFDVVYMGELHDRERISLALTTAESGVLVIATLRSHSVVKSLERIVNSFSADVQPWVRVMISNTLRCVAAQCLVNKADDSGRCVVNEVLVATGGINSAIREGYINKLGTMIQSGGLEGMITMDDALSKKITAGVITKAEAQLHANDKTRFQEADDGEEIIPEAAAAAAPAAPAAQAGVTKTGANPVPAAPKPGSLAALQKSAPTPGVGRTGVIPPRPAGGAPPPPPKGGPPPPPRR